MAPLLGSLPRADDERGPARLFGEVRDSQSPEQAYERVEPGGVQERLLLRAHVGQRRLELVRRGLVRESRVRGDGRLELQGHQGSRAVQLRPLRAHARSRDAGRRRLRRLSPLDGGGVEGERPHRREEPDSADFVAPHHVAELPL